MKRRRKSRSIFRARVKSPDVYFHLLQSMCCCYRRIRTNASPVAGCVEGAWLWAQSRYYLTPRLVKYCVDDCRCFPGTFLERMRLLLQQQVRIRPTPPPPRQRDV
jgi:hypothetical protein